MEPRRSPARAGRAVAAVALAAALAQGACAANPYYDAAKAHHLPDGFRNLDPAVALPPSQGDFLRWQWERLGHSVAPPTADLSPVAPPRERDGRRAELEVTWVGHATVLVRVGGRVVLTDPCFSERASPVQWMGPKRWQPPGVALAELPHVDVVVLSHDHYDHLDERSVRALAAQPGGPPLFVVPLGVERWLSDRGIGPARALDWWQSTEERGVEVHLVPAQHWSQRGLFDAMKTLWGGFVVVAGGRRVYFAGDTSYSRAMFADIGARFRPIDVALLPIGAYEPRWFMSAQHVSPREAVRMHLDLGARRSIGVHWGTFELTDEPLDQPPRDLAVARGELGVPEDAFFTLRHGTTWRLDDGPGATVAR